MKKKLFPIIAMLALGFAFAFAGCAKDGEQGPVGPQGPQGEQGIQGPAGPVGPQGGTLDEDCDHVFVEHILEHATCVQPKVTAKVCTKCNGYETVVGEVAKDVHGNGYDWKAVNNEMKLVLDDSCVEIIPGTAMEEANGACQKKKCNACGEMLKQHAVTDWYPVDENANICEEEHMEVEACTKCHAAVSDVEVKGARGHVYGEPVVVAPITNGYKVKLTCETCDKEIEVNATFKSEKVANCQEGGYKIYEYTYNDYLKDITKEFKYDITQKTKDHTWTDGTNTVMFAHNEEVHFEDNAAAMKALFNAGIWGWSDDGAPSNCSDKKDAIGDCAICGNPFSIELYGEHLAYGEEQKPDCVTNPYKQCADCGHKYDTALAVGHNYVYVTNTLDTNAMTIQIKCTTCNDTDTVDVTVTTDHVSQNCKDKSYKIYSTAPISNGLTAPHANAGTKVITVRIEGKATHAHTFTNGTVTVQVVHGNKVNFNDSYKALLADGTLEWMDDGIPATCDPNAAKDVYGVCSVCGNKASFELTGEHTLNGVNDVTAPGCTTRGYTTQDCTVCGTTVEIASVEAKGHIFVADDASLAAFKAAPANGKTVVFKCACNESVTLAAVATTSKNTTDCVIVDKTTYTFTYTYKVEAAAAGAEKITKTFTYTYDVDKTSGSHTLTGISQKLVHGNYYNYNDEFAAVIAAGKLEWADDGIPATCDPTAAKDAIFFCEVCENPVMIELSGEHDIANAPLKEHQATCTAPGYTYKECAVCDEEVKIEDKDALGHDVEWSVVGADKDNAGKAVGVCSRCNNTVEVAGVVVNDAKVTWPANCGKDGQVTYKYVDSTGKKVVEDKSFVIPRTGLHNDVEPLVRIEFVEGDYKYVAYFCDVCECYVVESKTKVQK